MELVLRAWSAKKTELSLEVARTAGGVLMGARTLQSGACEGEVGAQLAWEARQEARGAHVREEPDGALRHRKQSPAT